MMERPTWFTARRIRPRMTLGLMLVVVAALAVVFSVAIPWVKATFFAERWNTWIVRTETRPDGSQVRVRIRRYPDRDVVYEEVIRPAPPDQGSPPPGSDHPAR